MVYAGKIHLISISKPLLNVLMQLFLIVFDRQEVVGLLIANVLRDLLLAAHDVNRHQATLDMQQHQ